MTENSVLIIQRLYIITLNNSSLSNLADVNREGDSSLEALSIFTLFLGFEVYRLKTFRPHLLYEKG